MTKFGCVTKAGAALKNHKFILTVFLLTVILLVAGVYYTQTDKSAPQAQTRMKHGRRGHDRDDAGKPVVVAIETATQGDYPIYLTGLGTVTPIKTVTVHSRLDGELIRVTFTEGQSVRQGELLAEIDPRPFQILLEQAQGQLMRDEALLKNARLDQTRYDTLLAQESIPAQQCATQRALVKQYEGTVEMDRAQVNNARLQLEYTRLTAPISGQAGLRRIDQGNIIHAGDANGLVVITQLQPINVIFALPEDKVQPLIRRRRGDSPIAVTAFDRSGKIPLAEGGLTALDNQIDPATGTLKLKAQFDNADGELFPNQFVNIRMHLNTLPAVTLVSSAAIQHDAEGAFVFVVDQERTVAMRRVTLGPGETGDGRVAVLSGLQANETVVVDGIDKLRDGSRVDIAQKDDQPVAAVPRRDHKSRKTGEHSE
ncbi:MAG: MdtA/MuxA family multidrug efflux RND transporter periplasmic adaptor subunit [Methylococcales bacterium]|nr:MdtA/MuxA family multidrug efflux RND transporter periplasmic adaptor subunit [Methylococcales bacterium]